MPTVTEGQLTFTFPDHWQASKLDGSSFYRHQFQQICTGTKAVDIVAVDPQVCCWTMEAKDYRRHQRTRAISLAEEVSAKVRDSLAALAAAQVNANDATEKALAGEALRCPRLRVVLHLEQPTKPSRLFPRAIDPANVQLRLRQLVKAVDPHPLVLETAAMHGVAWTVQ